MEAAKLSQLKEKLEQEEQRLKALVQRTAQHINRDEPVSADFAEQATETSNDEVVGQLDEEARLELVQIHQALHRIEEGSYGICELCDAEINEERLQVLPHTNLCINCAE